MPRQPQILGSWNPASLQPLHPRIVCIVDEDTPEQAVFGRIPRLPPVLLSDESAGIGIDSSEGNQVAQFAVSARSEVLKALADFEADRALRAAIPRKTVPTRLMDLQPGQSVGGVKDKQVYGARLGKTPARRVRCNLATSSASLGLVRTRLKATIAGPRMEAACTSGSGDHATGDWLRVMDAGSRDDCRPQEGGGRAEEKQLDSRIGRQSTKCC